jgi:ABC-type lipoprotein export system ATPase subunit
VVVTHDVRVLPYADRTVRMVDGRIAESAQAEEMVA